MNTLKSDKSVKWSAVCADWRDTDNLLEQIQKELKKMGVTMAEVPGLDGGDSIGFILSKSKLNKKQIEEIDQVLCPLYEDTLSKDELIGEIDSVANSYKKEELQKMSKKKLREVWREIFEVKE
jgi:hypothetical protein